MLLLLVDESGKSIVKLKGKSGKIMSIGTGSPPKFSDSRTLVYTWVVNIVNMDVVLTETTESVLRSLQKPDVDLLPEQLVFKAEGLGNSGKQLYSFTLDLYQQVVPEVSVEETFHQLTVSFLTSVLPNFTI